MGGTFQTTEKRYVKFKLPEFSLSKSIKWNCHVDSNTDPRTTNYDLIVGTDLMTELQLRMDFREKTMTWDDMTAAMKSTNCTKKRKVTLPNIYMSCQWNQMSYVMPKIGKHVSWQPITTRQT